MIHERQPTWVEKGILTIGDIIDENWNILNIAEIRRILDIDCNFWLHLSLKRKIRLLLNGENRPFVNARPRLSCILHSVGISNKGNKNTYFNTMEKDLSVIVSLKEKME